MSHILCDFQKNSLFLFVKIDILRQCSARINGKLNVCRVIYHFYRITQKQKNRIVIYYERENKRPFICVTCFIVRGDGTCSAGKIKMRIVVMNIIISDYVHDHNPHYYFAFFTTLLSDPPRSQHQPRGAQKDEEATQCPTQP